MKIIVLVLTPEEVPPEATAWMDRLLKENVGFVIYENGRQTASRYVGDPRLKEVHVVSDFPGAVRALVQR